MAAATSPATGHVYGERRGVRHLGRWKRATYSPILALRRDGRPRPRGGAKTRALRSSGNSPRIAAAEHLAPLPSTVMPPKDVTLLIDDGGIAVSPDATTDQCRQQPALPHGFHLRGEGESTIPQASERHWGANACWHRRLPRRPPADQSSRSTGAPRASAGRMPNTGNRHAGLGTRLGSRDRTVREELRARCVDPAIPEELGDREGQAWTPLIAIAELAGGSWPELARTAAVALSKHVDCPASYGERLLADIRKILDGKDAISTSNLAFHLGEMEEQPWPTIRKGKEINGHVLAGMLKEYGIKPDQVWIDGKNHRGYERAWFEDAWSRYLTL